MWLWVWVRPCTGAGSDEHEPKSQQVLSRANPTTNPQDAKKCGLGMLQVARSVTNLLQVARSVERDKWEAADGGRKGETRGGWGGRAISSRRIARSHPATTSFTGDQPHCLDSVGNENNCIEVEEAVMSKLPTFTASWKLVRRVLRCRVASSTTSVTKSLHFA